MEGVAFKGDSSSNCSERINIVCKLQVLLKFRVTNEAFIQTCSHNGNGSDGGSDEDDENGDGEDLAAERHALRQHSKLDCIQLSVFDRNTGYKLIIVRNIE